MAGEKFCRDCKHARRDLADMIVMLGSYRFAKCALAPKDSGCRDYFVTGKMPRRELHYCSVERDFYDAKSCGPGAKNFEAKRG